FHPAIALAGKIFSAVGLAGVLNHDEIVLLRNLQDRVHVGNLAIKMDRNYRRYRPATPLADQLASSIWQASSLEVIPQLLRIQVVRALVDVDKLRQSARLDDGLGRGNKGMRNRKDNIAGPHACSHDRETQSIGSAAHRDRMLGLTSRRESLLELLHHRPTDEAGSLQSPMEHLGQLWLQFNVRGDEVKKGNDLRAVHWLASFHR